MRKLILIKHTRNDHRCKECNKIMKKGERAITIIDTDGIYKHIAYLCDNNHCLNEWELKQGAYQDEILENSIK